MEVAERGRQPSTDELRRILREQAGLEVVALAPTSSGESGSAFWVTDDAGAVSVLKIMPDAAPEAAGYLYALDAALARLRERGYPAPQFRAVGHVPGAGVLGAAAPSRLGPGPRPGENQTLL